VVPPWLLASGVHSVRVCTAQTVLDANACGRGWGLETTAATGAAITGGTLSAGNQAEELAGVGRHAPQLASLGVGGVQRITS
jgi:hypothetical protein